MHIFSIFQAYTGAFASIASMAPQTTADRDADEIMQSATLGHLRLRHIETNEILLIPTPSRDPNDPLNW